MAEKKTFAEIELIMNVTRDIVVAELGTGKSRGMTIEETIAKVSTAVLKAHDSVSRS